MNKAGDIQEASEELVKLDVLKVKEDNYTKLQESLSVKLSHLINHNLSGLVQLLYKLDISEGKLTTALTNTNGDAAEIIAELIIARQLEKIESRRVFKKQEDIPEDERW